MQVEFFHNTATVGLDRVDAEVEGIGYLFVGLAEGYHGEDFSFATGEEVDGIGDVFAVIGEDGVGDGRAYEGFAAVDEPDGFDEIVVFIILEQVASGTGAKDLADIDRIAVHAEGKDFGLRTC